MTEIDKGGAPQGNQNAKKGKLVTDAIRKALLKSADPDDPDYKKLHKMADTLVDQACDGDTKAIQLVTERMDGKPVQPIAGDEESGPIQIVINRFTAPADGADSDTP
jgi:hypothetical protein